MKWTVPQVNGELEPEDYSIRENDVIETRNYYTVRQIAQFMDLVIDTDQMIFVNNEEADLDTLVYENFSVEWKTDEYGVARIDNNNYNDTQESDSDDASVLAEQDANSTESDNTVARTSEQMMNQVIDELHDDFAKEAEASAVPENELPENELPKNDIQEEIHEEDSSENTVTVIVNGEASASGWAVRYSSTARSRSGETPSCRSVSIRADVSDIHDISLRLAVPNRNFTLIIAQPARFV